MATISLILMALGIVFIFWAMFSIHANSDYFSGIINGTYSTPTTFSAETSDKLTGDITTSKKSEESLYNHYPAEGDNIGSLTIPALNRKLDIIQGTDVDDLNKGVGHFIQSVLPGEKDNCVFSGHRDTVFRELGNLKIGDQLIVQTSVGTFTYEVKSTRIVHEDDKTVIVPIDHAVLTMTTCYPFYAIGNAPDRYIVSADLLESKSAL